MEPLRRGQPVGCSPPPCGLGTYRLGTYRLETSRLRLGEKRERETGRGPEEVLPRRKAVRPQRRTLARAAPPAVIWGGLEASDEPEASRPAPRRAKGSREAERTLCQTRAKRLARSKRPANWRRGIQLQRRPFPNLSLCRRGSPFRRVSRGDSAVRRILRGRETALKLRLSLGYAERQHSKD
jgi:hypothetical protein